MCSRYLIGDGTFEALKEGFFEILDEEGEDFFSLSSVCAGISVPPWQRPCCCGRHPGRGRWQNERTEEKSRPQEHLTDSA